VIVLVLLLSGVFFLSVSTLGILRLPDFYSRAHAAGKSETLGAILVLGADVTQTAPRMALHLRQAVRNQPMADAAGMPPGRRRGGPRHPRSE